MGRVGGGMGKVGYGKDGMGRDGMGEVSWLGGGVDLWCGWGVV